MADDEIPMDVETIKKHILARRDAIEVCLRENTILSEKLRQQIGPLAWLEWMHKNVKDVQDDIIGEFIKQQEAASGG